MHASTALNDRNDLNPPIRRLPATGRLALGVAALLAAATLASGAPLYVDDDAPPGGDGLSWETAMNDLGAALALAGPQSGFDEVRVAEGTYRPGPPRGSRTSSFPLRNLVRLAGGYAGMNAAEPDARDIVAYPTILSGDLNGNDDGSPASRADNVYHVVDATDTDVAAVLDGFTITGGFAAAWPHRDGAGLWGRFGSPTILDCTFAGNRATGFGAGAYFYGGAPLMARCTFVDNDAPASLGGAIAVDHAFPIIVSSRFMTNHAAGGGAIFNFAGSITVANTEFVANSCDWSGGAITSNGGSLSIVNSTFAGNAAANEGGAMALFGNSGTFTIANSIVWGSIAPTTPDRREIALYGAASLMHTCVQDWVSQNDDDIVFTEDPVFDDAAGADGIAGTADDDLSLAMSSPYIDGGLNELLPTDAADLDGDGNTDEVLPLDLLGLVRIQNGIVDLGAFESSTLMLIPGDLDGNGIVDFADVLLLLNAWGEQCVVCGADLNGDGIVDANDLALILSLWTP